MNAINKFTSVAKIWNTNVFGNIFARKRRIIARLKGIQNANSVRPSQFLIDFDKELRREYAEVQEIEEEFSVMKSRVDRLVHGDRNTSFYHISTIARRQKKPHCLFG